MRSSSYTNYLTASWWPLWRWDDQHLVYSEWAHESSLKAFASRLKRLSPLYD